MSKPGISYQNFKSEICSFDLILFAGADVVSHLIKYLEKRRITKALDENYDKYVFSHVGIAIRNDVLPELDDDVYVWESTMSGRLGEGTKNVDGKAFLGVQLRNFTDVLKNYDKSKKTRIAISHLRVPFDMDYARTQFQIFFDKKNKTFYDANCYSLLSSLFVCLRGARSKMERESGTEEWLFCSELAALTYKSIGIFPDDINEKDVVPQDFIGADVDCKIPQIFEEPVVITYYT